jgi:hypothetical protein
MSADAAGKSACATLSVRCQVWGGLIRLQEPRLAIVEILDQRAILISAHFAGPDDGLGVDVG